MLDRLREALAAVHEVLTGLEPRSLTDEQAAAFVDSFAELERLACAGRTLAGRRVQQGWLWRAQGYRTPAQWMAAHAQTTVSAAITTLETGRAIERRPVTRAAFRSGALSAQQAHEVATTAQANPQAEESLLATAHTESVVGLRERCREIRAASPGDPDALERIHRARFLRHRTDPDGAVRLDALLAPDAGARLVAAVNARARLLSHQARSAGHPERGEAHAADALVALAEGAPGPKAVVHVLVDHAAWQRGEVAAGERCRVPGLGPIPVATARRLAADGVVKAVLVAGADVRGVAHLGRTIPARLRTALEARDSCCVVPGCDARTDLEIDHVVPLAEGGPTRLDNLARLCRFHHGLKTYRGWRLEGGPGAWRWVRPRQGHGAGVPPSPSPSPPPSPSGNGSSGPDG